MRFSTCINVLTCPGMFSSSQPLEMHGPPMLSECLNNIQVSTPEEVWIQVQNDLPQSKMLMEYLSSLTNKDLTTAYWGHGMLLVAPRSLMRCSCMWLLLPTMVFMPEVSAVDFKADVMLHGKWFPPWCQCHWDWIGANGHEISWGLSTEIPQISY